MVSKTKKRPKRKKQPSQKTKPKIVAQGDPSSVWLTVFWMLTTLTTIAAELFYLVLKICDWSGLDWESLPSFTAIIFFVALTSGLTAVVTAGVVLGISKVWQPRSVVIVSVVSGLIPLALIGLVVLI